MVDLGHGAILTEIIKKNKQGCLAFTDSFINWHNEKCALNDVKRRRSYMNPYIQSNGYLK